MKFIKQIITDAKKQKNVTNLVQKNSQATKSLNNNVNTATNIIPTIEVVECNRPYFDEKIFEYDMIRRAREAEALLAEFLYNFQITENHSRLHITMEHLISRFKVKKPHQNIPKIQIVECVSEDDSILYSKYVEQAEEARKVLDELLNTTEDVEIDHLFREAGRDATDSENKQRRFRATPSKRIAFKGKPFNLDAIQNNKKRKLLLEITTNSNMKKLQSQNSLCENVGIEGKFTAMEM